MTEHLSPRIAFSETILELAKADSDIMTITSDTVGSTKLGKFKSELPEQHMEVGIAEQNAVGVGAGLATTGKNVFVCGHAPFYSTRVYEQVKNDVAYSDTNVTIIGASGGLSYSRLGSTHHSLHDIAAIRAIPNIGVILPSDYYQVEKAIEALADHTGPFYLRMGRNPRPTVYHDHDDVAFELGKANLISDGADITLIGTGRMVEKVVGANDILADEGVDARIIDMHTIKPLDTETIIAAAKDTGKILTVEEHHLNGGLGSAVSEVVSRNHPVPVQSLGIPDEFSISGGTDEVFSHYGLDSENISEVAKEMLAETN